jgi:hypothetical protein
MSTEELLKFGDTLRNDITTKVTELVRWYIGLSFGFTLMLGGFIGWTAKTTMDNKSDHEALKSDFATVLLITQPEHKDAIMFNEMVRKYNPSRGLK